MRWRVSRAISAGRSRSRASTMYRASCRVMFAGAAGRAALCGSAPAAKGRQSRGRHQPAGALQDATPGQSGGFRHAADYMFGGPKGPALQIGPGAVLSSRPGPFGPGLSWCYSQPFFKRTAMGPKFTTTFTGLRFENPFLLASAPPTESDSNIMRAFDAGWGGVVTKTIGLHPVVNVAGPKTKFLRARTGVGTLSMQKRPGAALHSSWNWELISDKPLDWWVPRIARIKRAHPERILVASIMAGSGTDEELRNWQTLAKACQGEGADALELNLSCPHMDRKDMGSNIGKDQGLISIVTQAVAEVASVPIWAKLTPSTTDIVVEAGGAFLGGEPPL